MKIAIDAGHGLHTAGKRCLKSLDPSETREWVLNSRVVDILQKKLEDYDVEVMRTDDPTGEQDIGVTTRQIAADAFGADFLISVHHNAGMQGGSGGGIVAYYDTTKTDSQPYAQKVYEYVLNRNGLKGNRSQQVATRSLGVCRTKCPAVLLENGFMDSSTDVPIILTEQYAELTALGLLDFFVGVFGIHKKSPEVSEEKVCYIGKVNSSDGFLNMRSTPSSSKEDNIIAIHQKNEYLLILEELSNGWRYAMDVQGRYGYVFGTYLDKLTEGDFLKRKVTDATGLNIRNTDGMSGELIATIPLQATFMVLTPASGHWAQVWCGDTVGYADISDKYSRQQ